MCVYVSMFISEYLYACIHVCVYVFVCARGGVLLVCVYINDTTQNCGISTARWTKRSTNFCPGLFINSTLCKLIRKQ